MLQSKMVILALALVIVVGVGFFAMSTQVSAPVPESEDGDTVSQSETPRQNEKKMAFSEFIKQGGSYKCSVNQSVGGVETNGTTYISGGMIRGEYRSAAEGMNVDSTLVVRDGYTYTWTSMMPGVGFKSNIVETTGAESTTAGMSGTYSWNAEQIGDYSCESWDADSSLFEIPKDITFREMMGA
jgi:hypothetical protein